MGMMPEARNSLRVRVGPYVLEAMDRRNGRDTTLFAADRCDAITVGERWMDLLLNYVLCEETVRPS